MRRGKKMEPMPGEEPLEGLESFQGAPVRRKRSEGEHAAKTPGSEAKGPSFQRYRAAEPYKCDECVDEMVGGGKWKAPNRASHIFRVSGGAEPVYLCYPHASAKAVEHHWGKLR